MGDVRNLFRTVAQFFAPQKLDKERVNFAVAKSFKKGGDGLWRCGNHVMTEYAPPVEYITNRLVEMHERDCNASSVRSVICFLLLCRRQRRHHRSRLFEVYLNITYPVNNDVPHNKIVDTVNNFADQFTQEFLKHYNENEAEK